MAGQPRDGTGRVHGVTDPEQRVIGLTYGSGPSRNDTTGINGPGGTHVNNEYLTDGPFTGRLSRSVTWRARADGTTETVLATTTYSYADLTPASDGTLQSRLEAAAAGLPAVTLAQLWPGYATASLERQTVTQLPATGSATSSQSYADPCGSVIASVSDGGAWSVTIPDPEGRPRLTADFSTTGSLLRRTLQTYDGVGQLLRSEELEPGQPTIVTRYTYDDVGRQTKVERSSDGGATFRTTAETIYDAPTAEGRRTTQVDAEGNRSSTLVDAAGRTVEERFEGVNGSVRWTRYGYDEHGRRNRVQDSRGLETGSRFDAAGREINTTVRADGRSYSTRRGYDPAGRLVWQQDPQQASVSPAIYTTYHYETAIGVDDPRYGQLLRVNHEDTNQDPLDAYPAGRSYERYEYDAKGRQIAVIKPVQLAQGEPVLEVRTLTEYDAEERVAAMVFNSKPGVTTDSQTNLKFRFGYDAKGNRSEVIYPSGLVKQWSHTYETVAGQESLTRLVETQPSAAGAPATFRDTHYDADGRLSYELNGNGDRRTHYYNAADQLVQQIYTPANAPALMNVAYGYDDDGRQTSVKQSAGLAADGGLYQEQTTYDPETGQAATINKLIDGIALATLSYDYDAHGALASTSLLGNTSHYEYDRFGRLLRADDGKQQYEYTYAPCGKKATVRSAADGTLENYAYDGLGRLLSITQTEQSSERILFKIQYQLGPDGNRLGIVETDADGAITTKRYTYDALGRLVADQSGSGSAPTTWAQNNTYSYDVDSNRLTHGSLATGQTFSYSYVAGSQRLAAIRVNGLLHQDFTWSANGEQTQVRSYGQDGTAVTETQTQTWNPDGSMAAVAIDYTDVNKPDITVCYGYDHTGTLISRKVTRDSGSSALPPVVVDWERYAVDHRNLTGYSQVAAVFKVSGTNGQINKLARLHFLTDQVAAQIDFTGTDSSGAATAITRNLHTDGLGSIRTVNTRAQRSSVSSGGSGGIGTADLSVTPLSYTAFGTPTEPASTLRPTEYAFTGQMRDGVTGQQYHRARWYETACSKWTAFDPIFDFPGSFGNQSQYVGQNPVTRTDKIGSFSLSETSVVAAIQTHLVEQATLKMSTYVVKAIVAALQIDPSSLIEPLFEQAASAIGVPEMMEVLSIQLMRLMRESGISNQQLQAILSKYAEFMSALMIIMDALQAVLSLLQFTISRTFNNFIELLENVWHIFSTYMANEVTWEIELNPTWQEHHLYPILRGRMNDAYKRGLARKFERWFRRGGLDIRGGRGPNTMMAEQWGGHSHAYYKFVYDAGRKHIRRIPDRRSSSAWRQAMLNALDEIEEAIRKNPEMLHPNWNGPL